MNTLDEKHKCVNELIKAGKAKGMLTYKEIMNMLGDIEIEPDQFDRILESLEAMGIEVVNELPQPDAPQEGTKPAEPSPEEELSACTSRKSARCRF